MAKKCAGLEIKIPQKANRILRLLRKEEAPRDSKIEFQNNKKESYERNKETPF